jgi:hypothetical protein
MMNFRELRKRKMTPEAWAEVEKWEEAATENKIKFANMTNETLVASAQYYISQCEPVRWAPGVPVYDATLAHFILPELMRRVGGAK